MKTLNQIQDIRVALIRLEGEAQLELDEIVAAAVADARRAALESAIDAAAPYHRSPDGRGCPRLCASCEALRGAQDRIRALLDDAPRMSCYCDAPEIQATCPVHGDAAKGVT